MILPHFLEVRRTGTSDHYEAMAAGELMSDNLLKALAASDAITLIHIFLVGAQDMLSLVTPAVLGTFFIRVIRVHQASSHVDRLATQKRAGWGTDRLGQIEVFFKGHARSLPSQNQRPAESLS